MWSSHATRRPVAYDGLHRRIRRRAVILHTNGGGSDNGSLYGWWTAGARGDHGPDNRHVGAQLQIKTNGRAEQYVDTDLVVYHAYSASEWAVGIETEDDGDPSRPWTGAQCDTIIAICRELEVPGRLLLTTESDGIGWHELYGAWNKTGHRCPGRVREQQIKDVILPALRQQPHHPPAPTPPAPTPAPHPMEDDMWIVKAADKPETYTTDFKGTKWHIPNPVIRDEILKTTGRQVQIVSQATLDALKTV